MGHIRMDESQWRRVFRQTLTRVKEPDRRARDGTGDAVGCGWICRAQSNHARQTLHLNPVEGGKLPTPSRSIALDEAAGASVSQLRA
jgi:hypothetical protein